MTEEEARAHVARIVGDDATRRIATFLDRVVSENAEQNLIAPSTIATIWLRHALDSIQLLPLAAGREGLWIDIGTGGGFPGLVIAIAWDGPVMLVEPRRRRAAFLTDAANAMGLTNVTVRQGKVESIEGERAGIISARAVASVENLLHAARHCGTPHTRWLLPRGKIDPADLAGLRGGRTMFHVEQSITDERSAILVIDGAPA